MVSLLFDRRQSTFDNLYTFYMFYTAIYSHTFHGALPSA